MAPEVEFSTFLLEFLYVCFCYVYRKKFKGNINETEFTETYREYFSSHFQVNYSETMNFKKNN